MRMIIGQLGLALSIFGTTLAGAATPTPTAISYGPATRQAIDYYPAASRGAPLVVFVHGGAWRFGDMGTGTGDKPAYFNGQGYAFATINYRMVPEVTVADEARDVAAAVAELRRRAGALGFDPDRIALVGHSAGAHLAALVATDPRYLRAAGVPMGSLRAVALLDGAGYDVPRQMAEARPLLRRMYTQAFGTEVATQRALSPTLHAAAPNAAAFQIFHLTSRPDSTAQAEALAAALRGAGTPVETVAVTNKTHRELNQAIGRPRDAESARLAAFLKRALGK